MATAAVLNVYCDEGNKPEVLERAVDHVREYLAQTDLAQASVTAGEAVQLVGVAMLKHDFELARRILAGPLLKEPDNLDLLRWSAKVELEAGAYQAALDMAEKVLKRKPDDADAKWIQQTALEKLSAYLGLPAPR